MVPRIAVTIDRPVMEELRAWPDMLSGFVQAGAHVILITAEGNSSDPAESLLSGVDALVLSGGGDVHPDSYGGRTDGIRGVTPSRDALEFALFAVARRRDMGVLGICRGAQLINVALGGTLYTDLATDIDSILAHDQHNERLREPAHPVSPVPGSIVARWCRTERAFMVNSAHHQAVRDLAPGCTVAATSPDGVIEAYECEGGRVVGVQWHPELDWMSNPVSLALLRSFVRGIHNNR